MLISEQCDTLDCFEEDFDDSHKVSGTSGCLFATGRCG